MTWSLLYLDASALVKLVVDEPESTALREFLARWPTRAVSAIARVEVSRALLRTGTAPEQRERLRAILAHMVVLRVDDDVLSRAERIAPSTLRSLDAIHLATAALLGDDLGMLVTYDRRLAAAAGAARLRVATPH